MDKHTEIKSFALIAEKGSFAAAALAEGVTPVMMSRRLDALEARLGVKLVHRSTRGLNLTDAGVEFAEQCRQLLRAFEEAEDRICSSSQAVRGELSITAPAAFGRRHVAPHAPAFQKLHPDLRFSFNLTDALVDLVREGYDMGVRIGEVADPNHVAVKLYPNRRVVCGTPDYFRRHGKPETPEDLARHNCLAFSPQGGQQRGWSFMQAGRLMQVRVAGKLACNDGEVLFDWARQGLGLCWRSTWEIQRELKRGELVTVLDDYSLPAYDIQAVYPQQRYLPVKIKVFIAYLKNIYNTPGYWEGDSDSPRSVELTS